MVSSTGGLATSVLGQAPGCAAPGGMNAGGGGGAVGASGGMKAGASTTATGAAGAIVTSPGGVPATASRLHGRHGRRGGLEWVLGQCRADAAVRVDGAQHLAADVHAAQFADRLAHVLHAAVAHHVVDMHLKLARHAPRLFYHVGKPADRHGHVFRADEDHRHDADQADFRPGQSEHFGVVAGLRVARNLAGRTLRLDQKILPPRQFA